MQTNETTKIQYREPGEGAIKYARQYVEGFTRAEASIIIKHLLKGELHNPTDKRVKRCNYCGYYWHDDSLRNTKKTCCGDCKRSIKTIQRRQQRADKELMNPSQTKTKKKTKREQYYVYWQEYSYWWNHEEMIKYHRNMEMTYTSQKMDIIDAARQRDESIGGKRLSKKTGSENVHC